MKNSIRNFHVRNLHCFPFMIQSWTLVKPLTADENVGAQERQIGRMENSRNGNRNEKKVIFISHFTGEAELATLLKSTIEEKFLQIVEVFSSSHPEGLRLGDEWFSRIKANLEKANLVIVLFSPLSVTKPWINF